MADCQKYVRVKIVPGVPIPREALKNPFVITPQGNYYLVCVDNLNEDQYPEGWSYSPPSDITEAGTGTANQASQGGLPGFFDLNNPDLQFTIFTLLILAGLGIMTGAGIIDLLYMALIAGALYIVFEGVKTIKDFIENALDNIIPQNVKDWLDKSFPGGYKGFKQALMALALSLLGYEVYKHSNIGKK